MDISKDLWMLVFLATGIYVQMAVPQLHYRGKTLEWPQRAAEASVIGLVVVSGCTALSLYLVKPIVLSTPMLLDVFNLYKEKFPQKLSGTMSSVSILILTMPVLTNMALRKIYFTYDLYERFGTELDKLYIASYKHGLPLKFVFESSLFHVGYVLQLPEIGKKDKIIVILPLISGKVDNDSGADIYNRAHTLVLNSILGNKDVSEIDKHKMVLSLENLSAVQMVDLHSIYENEND
ncbi:hypothetical protein [Ferrimonas balearica]|uniref:hypothetical protein n=1 Tax=Ferrimonas balearica TaxID=44012 RepID=UPI001F1B08E9|nr:hypothetical protein [Ferrimonas balearica]MBY6096351.1 hypothetical protein [Ferrimonas balearica]